MRFTPSEGIHPDDLRRVISDILAAAGLLPADAAIVADTLVAAEMRGLPSHGVARVPIYVQRLELGLVNPRPRMRYLREEGATALLDADNGPGQPAAASAMARAIELAKGAGIGACVVRNSNHCGALAYYTQQAVGQIMIGFAATSANANVAPWGAREAVLGTNPISAAVPTPGDVPFVLDMSTSAVARGKIIMAAKVGAPIPEGWALDPDGRPTRDARAALGGVLLPAAGPKGYGLAVLVDVLCGVLAGSAFGRQIGALYDDLNRPQRVGHFMMAVDISRFVEVPAFLEAMGALITDIKSAAPAEGFDEVLLPGEPEARAEARARREGVFIQAAVYQELLDLGRRFNVRPMNPGLRSGS
jgi:LDH2 family malate/lactate/ureidoglycolate dehydrogenase